MQRATVVLLQLFQQFEKLDGNSLKGAAAATGKGLAI